MAVGTFNELMNEGRLWLGAWMKIAVNQGSYKTKFLSDEQEFSNPKKTNELIRFVGQDEAGRVKAIGANSRISMMLEGMRDYEMASNELHYICDCMYSLKKNGVFCRSITLGDFLTGGLEEILPLRKYWIANPFVDIKSCDTKVGLYVFDNGEIKKKTLFDNISGKACESCSICPMYLFPGDSYTISIGIDENHDGRTKETPYEIMMF